VSGSPTESSSIGVEVRPDSYGLHLPPGLGTDTFLMNGAQYAESLRDGRHVVSASGEDVTDVTSHPDLARGVQIAAQFYDAQLDSRTRDVLTYADPDTGLRASLAWLIPRTRDDLRRKREALRWTTYLTLGTFGRPPDYGHGTASGLLAMVDRIQDHDPEWAGNVRRFLPWGLHRDVMSFGVVADVQSDRRIPVGEKPGRLRCVQERPDGIVVYGAKPCASVAVQSHIGIVNTLLSPGIDPDAMVYFAIPANSPGLTFVLREPVTSSFDPEDHPLDSRGEEPDAFAIFDHVLVPWELVFNVRNAELLDLYHEVEGNVLWHILARLAYRAEIFAGAAQLIVDALGTDHIPQVRDLVAEVTAYAQTLMAFVIASEEEATHMGGVLVPAERFVTPGRLHSVVHYPRVVQILRELSGQGLISRFTKAQWERPDVGPMLDQFLPGTGLSARDKNRLFNFVWDLTSGAQALRVALFENVNATPPAAMRAQIYRAHDRSEWARWLREFAGM
jgi:4-hydroxyphenylacetate 3-monooxygenase